MNQKKMLAFAYGSSFLILLILIILLYNITGKTTPVTLPTPVASNSSASPRPGDSVNENIKKLEITTDNVQSVIATMSRQESYSGSVAVKNYWSGGSAAYKTFVYVRSGLFRLSVTGPDNDPAKNIIITEKNFYIWYEGGNNYFTGSSGMKSDFTMLDKFEMIPTYEDILKLKKPDLLEASFLQYNNEPCIYVRAQSGDFEYTSKYYVSVNTGLLIASFTYDEDKLIYSMAADSVTLTVPPDEMFKLPDGKSLISS